MQTITLYLDEHRGAERIFAQFPYSHKINEVLRQLEGIKWSRTKKQWHLPVRKDLIVILQNKVKTLAALDVSGLKMQLEERKSKPLVMLPVNSRKVMLQELCACNQTALDIFIKTLQLKAYSNNTIKTYRTEFGVLLKLLGNRCVDDLQEEHIKSYILFLLQKKRYSESQAHTAINAVHPVGFKNYKRCTITFTCFSVN